MLESTHSCIFRNSLDLFQEPHPRPLVPGLQRVLLCQLCRGPLPLNSATPKQAVELLSAPGKRHSISTGVHSSALCDAASE